VPLGAAGIPFFARCRECAVFFAGNFDGGIAHPRGHRFPVGGKMRPTLDDYAQEAEGAHVVLEAEEPFRHHF